MSYQALARKYRPQTFADILGQESIVRTLANSIEQQRIHQAYLFSGVRGVGKTTAARIFAKALNCVEGPTPTPCNRCTICNEITEGIDLDVREIDAATYTQVENIRELRELTQFQPARDRNRIFIIDEAHMLSSGAWNALLKLIEEPPPHVVFIMATTELHKVPQTIRSRVQQFVFRTITPDDITRRLAEICESEEIEAAPEALEALARRGDGSVRDAISLLDQTVAFSGRSIAAEDVSSVLGLSDANFFVTLVERIHDGDQAAILEALEEAATNGRDFKLLFRDLLFYLRNMLLLSAGANESLLQMEPSEIETMRRLTRKFESSELLRISNALMRDDELVARSEQQRLAVEIAILKAAVFPRLRTVEDVLRNGGGGLPAERRSGSPDQGRREAPAEKRVSEQSGQKATPAARSGKGDLVADLIDAVSRERRSAAGYLRLAKESRLEDDRLICTFDARDQFAAEQLATPDLLELLERLATELRGLPTRVVIETTEPSASHGKKKRASVDEDPVIQAFARHLGGEVVPGGRSKKGGS